jgi:glycosyltransferase involved in cell wall biosynthesis
MVKLAGAVKERHEIWNPHHWPGQWAAVWLKRKLGGSVLWMCNDVPNLYEKSRQGGTIGRLSAAIHRLYYSYDRSQNRQVDLTMLLSNWAESGFKTIYPGRTCVVRSGADPVRFAPGGDRLKIRERFGYQPDDFVLLWLGIFMPHRRLQDAIAALAQPVLHGRKVKLLLAGSGHAFPEYFASLQELAAELGVADQVIFAGKVEDTEIRDFYCACDAFLFPNENQTWGLAVLEAMACDRPVLVSRGAAVHEVLTDEKDAILFPPREPAALAGKIALLMSRPDLRTQIARQGMELVRQQFNYDRFAGDVARLCEQLIQEKRDAKS